MTSKLADKEKRVEEYKDEIAKSNSSFEILNKIINTEQVYLNDAQAKNAQLRQMLNFLLQQDPE